MDKKNDVNKDGVEDGSPEAIGKLGQDVADSITGFFEGLLDGFSKYKKVHKPVHEEEKKGPQVLNEDQ